jgi:hypothetical protein
MGVVIGCWGLERNWSNPNRQKLLRTQIVDLSSTFAERAFFVEHVCFTERM